MKTKIYRLAEVHADSVYMIEYYSSKTYSGAYQEAIQLMKDNKSIVAMLIYSEDTQVVLKRKYADK